MITDIWNWIVDIFVFGVIGLVTLIVILIILGALLAHNDYDPTCHCSRCRRRRSRGY